LAFGRSASVPCERELMLHALHAPMARFARWLSLDAAYAQTLHDRVAPSPVLARIRGLRLQGHPLPVITALPNLEELELYDESAVSHPQLRRLRVVIASPLGVSLDGALPALERIELVSRSALGLWRTLMMYVPAQTVRTLAITTPALTEHHLTRIASLRAHVHVDITFET
ncbi:MAG TPA: hypothetical protein VK427_16385, partial [Kofleriaceae bacterium]|nr:hypothetical protein [Kofleriaceae bacterium]